MGLLGPMNKATLFDRAIVGSGVRFHCLAKFQMNLPIQSIAKIKNERGGKHGIGRPGQVNFI